MMTVFRNSFPGKLDDLVGMHETAWGPIINHVDVPYKYDFFVGTVVSGLRIRNQFPRGSWDHFIFIP